MACREYKNLFSAHIDDELKPLTRMRVEAHLRGCGRCRRQLRQMRRATEMVRGLERVEAPAFAVRRARSISLGDRARGWERLRGGLASRPQTLPLKPVLLAGLAFVMVLVISRTFDTAVAPQGVPGTATPAPQAAPSGGETSPGLPGTLSADRLSDAQKAEIARRVLEARAEEGAPALQPGTDEGPAGVQPDTRMASRDPLPQPATEPLVARPEPQSVARATPPSAQSTGDEEDPGQAGITGRLAPPQRESRIAAAPQPAGVVLIQPRAIPSEAAAENPQALADRPAPTSATPADPGLPPDALDLGETYRQVLVLAQGGDGSLDAAFHGADSDPSAGLRRYDDGDPEAALASESAGRALEDLAAPEADPETGITPPLAIYRPAPALEQRVRGRRNLGPLSPALLRVHILADGSVGSLALLSGSGLRWLDRAVLEAVRAWEFRPAERHQQAIAVSIELLVEFELE